MIASRPGGSRRQPPRGTAAVRKGVLAARAPALRHEDAPRTPARVAAAAGRRRCGFATEPGGAAYDDADANPCGVRRVEDELEEERLRAIVAERERNAAEWEKRELQARLLNVELLKWSTPITSVPPDWDREPLLLAGRSQRRAAAATCPDGYAADAPHRRRSTAHRLAAYSCLLRYR